MVRIISPFLLLSLSYISCFGKSVDENTAQVVGYNFCKTQGVAVSAQGLSEAYTATTIINGQPVVDFYVFNTGATGFVMVSGDDRVTPVLAYSTESDFNGSYLPGDISWWLGNYAKQINAVIQGNIPASVTIAGKWNELLQAKPGGTARTTSAGPVAPLLKTLWNQTPYYNYLCPFDAADSTYALTGCVATAMAQVMKYWNWPERGVGSNTYYDGSYGTLTADFGTTLYQWDSMPNTIGSNNLAIGTLMYQAGVSVNMSYGAELSGAYVLTAASPVTNCAQYALPNYFSYKSSILGEFRSAYTDSNWVKLIKSELNAQRPVIYSGYGTQGGHCFITDGYSNDDYFHFNWGWGGYCNAYFIVENLDPAADTFNTDQSILTGIEPDSAVVAAVKQVAVDNIGINVYPNPANEAINVDIKGTKTTQINLIDAAGRELGAVTPPANATIVTIPVDGLPDGTYLVELQTAEGTISRKVVVAR